MSLKGLVLRKCSCLCVMSVFVIWPQLVEAQGARLEKVSVDDARPVAAALEELSKRYGWVISYEDPAYVYAGEIEDATNRVVRNREGSVPRVLVPKGGRLDVTYAVAIESGKPANPAAVIRKVLAAYAAGGGAVFRLQHDGNRFYVIPRQAKNREGEVVDQASILDTPISFPEEERSGLETLDAICEAITNATHTRVWPGLVPINSLARHRVRFGADNQPARAVLATFLDSVYKNSYWQLFHGPGDGSYALNVDFVRSK